MSAVIDLSGDGLEDLDQIGDRFALSLYAGKGHAQLFGPIQSIIIQTLIVGSIGLKGSVHDRRGDGTGRLSCSDLNKFEHSYSGRGNLTQVRVPFSTGSRSTCPSS
jgi:hypothetical protein